LPPPLLSSFKDASLKAALETAPEFARALLIGELGDDWQARAEALGAAGLNVGRRKLTAEGAVAIKRAGYALSVWTVNEPDEARALLGMGADCIITDAPDVILRALAA
jgi:glycerophosphoryl diester phosphodiesterase